MNWKKIELYDDFYPWVVRSENNRWLIARDYNGNVLIYSLEGGKRKLKDVLSSECENPTAIAKEKCVNLEIDIE